MAKKKPKHALTRQKKSAAALPSKRLVSDLRRLIDQAREQVAQAVNARLSLLHWHIGRRIREEILGKSRAAYGQQIVDSLSKQLLAEYGRGFSRRNLFNMIRFAEVFPDEEIVQSVIAQLSWTHLLQIIPLDDPLKRDFYTEMCRMERWSVRTLRQKIDRLLYERTAVAKKPDELIQRDLAELRDEDRLTPDLVFRDPYFLDFLGLSGGYVEDAILRELESFILELGTDFAFIARQKRITVDDEDYYLDLLFYHRRLRRLVAIDLKLGKFQAADKGQMELYLRWLEAYEMQPGENPPLGLILCAGKTEGHVQLLRLDASGIRVARYLTALPPKKVLEKKLREAIRLARQRLTHRVESEPQDDQEQE